MRIRDIPPYAPSLMESTRAIGYSLETAIADLIDNSIAAGASTVSITFFPIDAFLSILDNGSGMEEEELVNAMRYGAVNPNTERHPDDLGRFGLGMKTASLSQCRKLTVVTKKNNVLSATQWDLDYISTTGDWSLKILDPEDMTGLPQLDELKAQASGTLVIWQELDRMKAGEPNFEAAMGRRMDDVRRHLSLVFHRYLKGEPGINRLEVFVNGEKLRPIDPFLLGKSHQTMDEEVFHLEGERIKITPFLLPHPSKLTKEELELLGGEEGLRRQQGFYVYRNKRLLIWGTWFRLARKSNLAKLARVRVDVPNTLDHLWTLDIKKSAAIPPAALRDNLKMFVERLAEKSKQTWTTRGRRETSRDFVACWEKIRTRDGSALYQINRSYPLVRLVQSRLDPDGQAALEQLLIHIERGLPLNSLYLDFNREEKVANEAEWTEDELIQFIKTMLSGCASQAEREQKQAELAKSEPFYRRPDIIEKFIGEAG